MGEPPPFDPCECIFSPAGAMRRLISLLRSSQSHCTDEQCFPTTQGLGNNDDSGVTMMYMAVAWIVLAFVLYMFRPQNLREDDNAKPSNSGNGRRDPPPAPPVM